MIVPFGDATFAEFSSIIVVIAGMMAGFFGMLRYILKQSGLERKDDRDERISLVESLNKVAESNKEIARATKQSAREAEKRNGHLAELVMQGTERTEAIAAAAVTSIIEGVQNIPEQHVEHSHVEHQEVINNKKGKK